MLDKCFNPKCSAKFRRLREGRVFVKQVEVGFGDGSTAHSHKCAYFWLCDSCCRTMTVVAEKGSDFRLIPLPGLPLQLQRSR